MLLAVYIFFTFGVCVCRYLRKQKYLIFFLSFFQFFSFISASLLARACVCVKNVRVWVRACERFCVCVCGEGGTCACAFACVYLKLSVRLFPCLCVHLPYFSQPSPSSSTAYVNEVLRHLLRISSPLFYFRPSLPPTAFYSPLDLNNSLLPVTFLSLSFFLLPFGHLAHLRLTSSSSTFSPVPASLNQLSYCLSVCLWVICLSSTYFPSFLQTTNGLLSVPNLKLISLLQTNPSFPNSPFLLDPLL